MGGCGLIPIRGDGCEWTKYIYTHPTDTAGTKAQALTHNLKRQENCE